MENTDQQHHRAVTQIQRLIQRENDFLISSHVNPDGDSIASILVFTSILRHMGKSYRILLDDDVPEKLDFMAGIGEIQRYDGSLPSLNPRVLIVLDSSNLERIGRVAEIVTDGVEIINIDHHPSNEGFGSHNLVLGKESSTVEIVYDLFTAMNVPLSPDIAALVYTGILCDTGRFLFPNTTSRSLEICSEMVKHGASPDIIAKKLYFRMSHETAKALSAALSTLEFHFDGTVSCIHLSNGAVSSINDIDTEGFVDYLLAIDGTEVEFLMVEKEPGLFRISFRSKSRVDVNDVAKNFGGGGHTRASGCTLQGTVGEVKEKILNVLKAYL
jgi:phosphoesterase RecJ-like protein